MIRHRRANRHYRRIFLIECGAFLFEIVIVDCSLFENGTFRRPDTVLGDNGTGYQKTVQATRKQDRLPENSTGYQKTGQAIRKGDRLPENGKYGHITHKQSACIP
ncbi:hypothetical protein AVEN_125235-1 [Araneus ventricosus]|uniref:Uncharacterized protein n=1 Tax=Araneus ventricosus TaxID=182803 RepID=A0A4Y2M357_ARAVE|nr:hypothetical protein AVEN_125235-1 [Araneus ventricosus]